MPHETRHNLIASPYESQTTAGQQGFAGFKPPTSNTTYTPNQFFDVVMPNASRGCLRIVAYLIRKTLGWCDANGNPQREQIEVPYGELVHRAGVSRDMIRDALDEAMQNRFIECLRKGRASSAGDFGESALFALKWDSTSAYTRSLADFRGFYEGEGHRTDIPNEFFDRLVPNENLSVIKVVGSVIRYSIGFQAKHGRRRQQATLAYSQILKTAGLSSRRTLAAAIREAVARNYIVRLDPGCVSAFVEKRRSATYAVRWSDGFHADAAAETSPKRIPAGLWINQSEKDTSGRPDQSEKDTSTSQERIPADQSEKESNETKFLNEKQKQAVFLLREQGFNKAWAEKLARLHAPELIEKQVGWVDSRHPTKSRTGLLKRAIEGDWPKPDALLAKEARKPEEETWKIETSAEAAHCKRFREVYRSWLEAEEATYRREHPEDYARFSTKRERELEDIKLRPPSHLKSMLLSLHSEREKRLLDFQQFIGLPDFWQWDANFNSQPFHPHS